MRSNTLQSDIPIEGKRPANVARHNGVLWADWEFLPDWSLGGGVYFVSSRFIDNANTAELPRFGRVDAVLGYHQQRWDLQFNVYNLGDKKYFESGQLRSALPGAPRAMSLSLKVHL